MPWSALPEHINEPHEWNGYDDDQHWYTQWRKSVKGWFAFGPRAKEWWARWRECPIALWTAGDGSSFRLEYTDGKKTDLYTVNPRGSYGLWYLSRTQYFKRWHIQIQWPLFFCFHWYWKKEDVLPFPKRGKLQGWMGYIGFKRDADRVYWAALYLGKSFK